MATENIDNKPVKSRKDAFMENFHGRYPDIATDDEEGFYGKLSDEFDRYDRSDNAQRELGDLLASDPRSAGFLMVMRKGGNPVEYLMENYGDDFKAALDSDEGKEKFSKAYSKYMEKQAKNKELQKQAEDNLDGMIDNLEKAQEEGKFSDEDARAAYDFLYGENGLLDRIIVNGVTSDDWMMLMKASNYDKSLAAARDEGEIAGRNANIDIKKRKKTKVDSMPPDIGSGGSSDNKPMNDTDKWLESLDKRERNSVWK